MFTMESLLEKILGRVVLGGLIIGFTYQCSNFLYHQDLDKYFETDKIYDFSEDKYLLKQDVELCGKAYSLGDLVDKDLYNKCNI